MQPKEELRKVLSCSRLHETGLFAVWSCFAYKESNYSQLSLVAGLVCVLVFI